MSRSRKKPPVVHFTTHACQIASHMTMLPLMRPSDQSWWSANQKYVNASVYHLCYRQRHMDARDHFTAAIDDMTLAGDLLGEVERLLAQASEFIRGTVDRINDGALDDDLDAVLGHIVRVEKERAARYAEAKRAAAGAA